MPTIRNVCPRGALDVPLLRCLVEAGAVVEVTAEHAERLLEQPDNWELVKAPSRPRTAAADTEGETR